MNTGAHPLKAGFNQSGGAYFMVMSNLDAGTGAVGSFVNTLASAGSNSGGAFTSPTLALTAMSNVIPLPTTAPHASDFVKQGALLKDMGKTVVSSGRVFRKFAPVAANTSNGVVGSAAVAPNAGYGSFYLEVGRETVGGTGAAPAPIVRYF
jgi:hypothetical protein